MDDTQPVWSVTASAKRLDYIADVAEDIGKRVQRDSEEGYAEVNNLAADVAWIARQLAIIVRSMSREGSKPSGADSTGETGADVCEARPPWRGQFIGVPSR